jgi:hypothetical protein
MANNSETIGFLMDIINRHKHLLELSKYEESILSEIINPNFSLKVNIDCPQVWCEFSHNLKNTIPKIEEISFIKNLYISVNESRIKERYNENYNNKSRWGSITIELDAVFAIGEEFSSPKDILKSIVGKVIKEGLSECAGDDFVITTEFEYNGKKNRKEFSDNTNNFNNYFFNKSFQKHLNDLIETNND